MKRTVFYIKPNAKNTILFQSVVDELLMACNGPSFIPHLTFYTGFLSENESEESIQSNTLSRLS